MEEQIPCLRFTVSILGRINEFVFNYTIGQDGQSCTHILFTKGGGSLWNMYISSTEKKDFPRTKRG